MPHKAIGSIIVATIAEVAPSINKFGDLHIPPVIMESFQCLAWFSAFILAVIAFFKYKKQIKK